VIDAETVEGVLPLPAEVSAVSCPNPLVVPYWKAYIVASPFGLMVPLTVALADVIELALAVVTDGDPAAAACETKTTATAMSAVTVPRRVARLIPTSICSDRVPGHWA
jgi:hypothetical protein